MEPLKPQPKSEEASSPSLEGLLQAVRQELTDLQQDVLTQLEQDVIHLRQEKAQLVNEIEQLKADKQALEGQQATTLPGQQQLWAKQLAQILATHLQATIVQRLDQMALAAPATNGESSGSTAKDAQSLLASLDSSLTETFRRLQRELQDHHSYLFDQLNRMQALEQRGETLLNHLEQRLQQPLIATPQGYPEAVPSGEISAGTTQSEAVTRLQTDVTVQQGQPTRLPPPIGEVPGASEYSFARDQSDRISLPREQGTTTATQNRTSPSVSARSSLNPIQIGFLYAFLSTIAFSVHNVVVRVIGRESNILGLFRWGGAVSQMDLGNSLMTLWLRMIVVLPLMVIIAQVIYPNFWNDIMWRFNTPDRRERRPLVLAIISGFFLFVSQILIYIAIGRIGPAPAITILFIYPLFTVLLSWLWLKRSRPTPMLWAVIGVVFLGVVLTVSPGGNLGSLDRAGISFAFFAGIFFALYMTWMDLSFEKLKPLPSGLRSTPLGNGSRVDPEFDKLKKPILITLVQFTTVCLLSNLILMLPVNLGISISKMDDLILGGLLIGSLALVAYLLNNFAVQKIGPGSTSIMSSLGPVLTAVLAFLLIGDPLNPIQWFGVGLVSAGVIAFTLDKNTGKIRP